MGLLIPAEKLATAYYGRLCEIPASDLGQIDTCVMISVIHLVPYIRVISRKN